MNLGQQHLHARLRIFNRLEEFPAQKPFKKYLDFVMYGVGIVQPPPDPLNPNTRFSSAAALFSFPYVR